MTLSKLKIGSELSVFNIYMALNHAVYKKSYPNKIIFAALVKILIFNEIHTHLMTFSQCEYFISYSFYWYLQSVIPYSTNFIRLFIYFIIVEWKKAQINSWLT